MKTDRITNMYNHLTNKERAALAFRYWTDRNQTEFDRVEAAVPRHTYRCLDSEYQSWLASFVHFASLWGIRFWQTKCRLAAATAAAFHFDRRGKHEEAATWYEKCETLEEHLAALDGALESMSEEHGIDANGVRWFADVGAERSLPGKREPDPEAQAEITRGFSEFLLRQASDNR